MPVLGRNIALFIKYATGRRRVCRCGEEVSMSPKALEFRARLNACPSMLLRPQVMMMLRAAATSCSTYNSQSVQGRDLMTDKRLTQILSNHGRPSNAAIPLRLHHRPLNPHQLYSPPRRKSAGTPGRLQLPLSQARQLLGSLCCKCSPSRVSASASRRHPPTAPC